MKIVQLIDEDFVNYKKPCMIIGFPYCNFKCDKECGQQVCQNSTLATANILDIDIDSIIERYLNNPITKAICFQGLEPFDSYKDIKTFISHLRSKQCWDDIVIYTGYNKDELNNQLKYLRQYRNIIIKFGRFIPNQNPHYDKILGINLASDNQYAKKIS